MSIKRKVELENIISKFEKEIKVLKESISNIKKLDEDLHDISNGDNNSLWGLYRVLDSCSDSDLSLKLRVFLEKKEVVKNSQIIKEKFFNICFLNQFRNLLKAEVLPDFENSLEEAELNLKKLTEELNEINTSSEIIFYGSQIISLLKQLLENKKGRNE